MDAQQTYLLNGLLARHFDLGRIVRFRQVERGRQTQAFELFTAQEQEYLVHLYPPDFLTERLEFSARTVNTLDENRFSVVPFLESKAGGFVVEGPQNSRMLVSLAPVGSTIPAAQYSHHDISQVGLRLGWMHRLLRELLHDPPVQESLIRRVQAAIGNSPHQAHRQGADPIADIETLLPLLHLPTAQGWVHGDLQIASLLLDGDHQIRTVTDWGLLHAGSPLEDVVDAFLALCTDPRGKLDDSKGHMLLEAYHSLVTIERVPWTPVVASWCAQRILDALAGKRPLPPGFADLLQAPERLSTALASCM